MNTFKRLSSLLLLVSFAIAGCEPEPTLSVTASLTDFSEAASESSIAITSNTSWKILGGDGWCSAVPSEGKGNATVKLVIQPNTTKALRTTTLTITADGMKSTLSITQEQNDALILTRKTENLDSRSQSVSVELKSNIKYDIIMPSGVDWITNVKSKGFDTYTHEFLIARNESYDSRSARIIFKDKNSTLADTLIINQAQKNALILTKKTENIGSAGGTVNVELKSNLTYDIIIPSTNNWISSATTKGLITYNHQFTVAANTLFDSRTGIVIFKDKNSTLSDTLTINQQALGALFLSKEKFYIQKSGGSFTYSVSSNVNYDITISGGSGWITQMQTKGLISKDYTFTVSANGGSTERSADIIFVSQGGALKDTVFVKQSGFDGFYVYEESSQNLGSLISESEGAGITRLKIEGNIRATDFGIIRSRVQALRYIDLSGAVVEENQIPDYSFKSDIPLPLQTFIFPKNIQTIGKEAFYNCSSISSIELPGSLTSVGNNAFSNCAALAKVYSKIAQPFAVTDVFSGISSSADLVVPKGTLNNYLLAGGWGYSFFRRIYEEGSDPNSYIIIRQNSIRSTGAASTYTISIDASAPWVIYSKPGWINVTPLSGSGSGPVQITFDPYTGESTRSGIIEFRISGTTTSAQVLVEQNNFPYNDGNYAKIRSSTVGNGIDLVFLGDGYSFDEIVNGQYETDMRTALGHFLAIEPYKSYSDYFNAYTVFAFSEQSGISDITKTVNTKFETKYTKAAPATNMSTNTTTCFNYAIKAPIGNLSKTVVILVANSTRYAGTAWMWSTGEAIAICPKSDKSYPYDFRGVVQHEASGHGFAKLADEYVNTTGMIPDANKNTLRSWQGYGFYQNVDLTNDLGQILWKHFIGQANYAYVSAYEGGYYYSQGVWRPESKSVMINNIKYINAPSREAVVKRIKLLAGQPYSFEDFKSHDVMELDAATKAASLTVDPAMLLPPPVLIEGSPKLR